MATITILNFENFHFWFSDCHRVASVQSCTQFYHNRNRMTFRWDMAILWFAVGLWRQFAILNFWNLEFMSCCLYRHAVLLPCVKFHWNRTISCRVMAKNNLCKWRPSAMLNSKIFIFGHVTHRILCTKFLQNRMNFFVEIWRFYDLQYGGRPPSWILWVQ